MSENGKIAKKIQETVLWDTVEIEFITKHWLRGEMFCRVRHPQ